MENEEKIKLIEKTIEKVRPYIQRPWRLCWLHGP